MLHPKCSIDLNEKSGYYILSSLFPSYTILNPFLIFICQENGYCILGTARRYISRYIFGNKLAANKN